MAHALIFDTLVFILGFVVTGSSFYVLYVHLKFSFEWLRWFILGMTGIIIMSAALLSGVFLLNDAYRIFLLIITGFLCLNSLMGFIIDSSSYRYY